MIAHVAAGFRERIGRPPVAQMRVTGARGEGRTLILNVDLIEGSPETIRTPLVASSMAIGICAAPRTGNFFSQGRVLRVEVTRAGRAEGSTTVDRCPGPAGQGLTAATFAAGMQSFVGFEESGMTIAAIRPEGNAVIVTLAFPAGASVTDATQDFLQGFCQRPADLAPFFGSGLILRVDTKIGERDPLPGPPVTACPPAATQADVDPLVAEVARRAQWPEDTAVRHVTLRGEGRTLVWAGEIAPDWTGPVLPGDMAPVIANTICAGAGGAAFFTEGRTLRVEIRAAGGASTSATVDRCSVPAGVDFTTAAGAASILQPLVGMGEDGVTITSIHADGETVVLVFDGPAGWRRGDTAEELNGVWLRYFCNPAFATSPFFDGTPGIRIDTLEGGRQPIQGRRIAGCPAR
ncbi:MAG TPA: hypothetical protein VEX35_12550 [Allosphingosinicella sp.]|nr:hypothetical protein [Allosphingosinicella sp.]